MSLKIADLIAGYKSDKVSPYRKLRHHTRTNYDGLLRRVERDHGDVVLSTIKYRTLLEWHAAWSQDGKHIPMGHSLIGMLRTLVGFGLIFLEDTQCERLCAVLHRAKFPMGKSREQFLTADQADEVRVQAHKDGFPSVALAQALQFEGTLRQKDIIGEYNPMSEPGVSEVTFRNMKWMRGTRWNEIDENLILRHVTSKKLKLSEIDLKLAPMVLEELEVAYCDLGEQLIVFDAKGNITEIKRHLLPASGPLILNEDTGRPYLNFQFRRRWRELARAAGIPDEVQNRDTRAGAITEAIGSGASIEDAQKAANHSTTHMTAKYWRGDAQAAARAMTMRAADRALKKQRKEDAA